MANASMVNTVPTSTANQEMIGLPRPPQEKPSGGVFPFIAPGIFGENTGATVGQLLPTGLR